MQKWSARITLLVMAGALLLPLAGLASAQDYRPPPEDILPTVIERPEQPGPEEPERVAQAEEEPEFLLPITGRDVVFFVVIGGILIMAGYGIYRRARPSGSQE